MSLSVEVINISSLNHAFLNYQAMIYTVGPDCSIEALVPIIFPLHAGCIYIFMKDKVV